MLERHHQEELEKLKRRGINLEDLDSDDDGEDYRFTSWEETLDSAEGY